MRIFNDPIEMYDEVGRDLWEMGIKVHPQTMQDKYVANDQDYETIELRAYAYQINVQFGMKQVEEMVKHANGNLNYCLAEFTDRVDPEFKNPGKSWKYMKNIWEEFIHNGKFAYTYNERYEPQLDKIIEQLEINPESRQAIITVYDHHDDKINIGGNARIPCSLSYQFLIREKKLDIIYIMRSCDYLLHFPHDVYLTIRLQNYMCDALDLEPGFFTHFMGSFHAYHKDIKSRGIF